MTILTKTLDYYLYYLIELQAVKVHQHSSISTFEVHYFCFCNFHSIPFSLRSRVEQELDHLEKSGVIEPIQFSDWAAPIVLVVKSNESARICGDFKLTIINKVAKLDTYPLSKKEELLSQLAGGKSFTKLYLAHAYLQIVMIQSNMLSLTLTKGYTNTIIFHLVSTQHLIIIIIPYSVLFSKGILFLDI